ncbi:unnamed protein product [Pleuronectes platessa]|uniref:Uncharacterized protein n=1 Tax=Pleuronectes platessa TaxID=8262 RepID=A0A9N7TIX9_PLEPL|nr:unnamed protein product [Pleuronectes platessa]
MCLSSSRVSTVSRRGCSDSHKKFDPGEGVRPPGLYDLDVSVERRQPMEESARNGRRDQHEVRDLLSLEVLKDLGSEFLPSTRLLQTNIPPDSKPARLGTEDAAEHARPPLLHNSFTLVPLISPKTQRTQWLGAALPPAHKDKSGTAGMWSGEVTVTGRGDVHRHKPRHVLRPPLSVRRTRPHTGDLTVSKDRADL